jgi:pimeloyl-ACP methyl ester carboxylesterase
VKYAKRNKSRIIMQEDVLVLKDGRQLGYGVYGNPKGIPIFDFHGIPGSRGEAALIASYLGREDLCFVGFDRPGYGRSTPRRGFRLVDLAEDVEALAEHLQINRFIVIGYSGGGPFALATTLRIPERIAALGIVSGVGPAAIGSQGMHESNRRKFNMAQRLPWLARGLLTIAFSNLRRNPNKLAIQMRSIWAQMPEPDRAVLDDDAFADGILAVTRDAIRHTVRGWVNEEVLMASPWQFDLQEVHCPHIFLWHGVLDKNVPVQMAKAVAEKLPGCQAAFLEGEGHISLLYNRGREIIDTLIRAGFPAN